MTTTMAALTKSGAGARRAVSGRVAATGATGSLADKGLVPRLAVGDFLDLWQLTRADFRSLLTFAARLKAAPLQYRTLLADKGLAMIFEKPSLRTRVTFDVAMQSMGGHAVFLDFTDAPLGEREDIVDVARNLELWLHAIVARTFEHASITLLADAASIPVVNGLSDQSHPCQALADFLTLQEVFGAEALYQPKGGRRRLKLAYVGDGNNTLTSLLEAAALAGADMSVATPPGYEPSAEVLARVAGLARASGSHIAVMHEIPPAVRGAHAIYTDTWASMGQEAEATQRARDFASYQVTRSIMKLAGPRTRFMHCLPAHRGQEVAVDVIDSPASLVYQQAENRLHAQKAVLAALILAPPRK